ncbi:MAG: transposase [Treponema sp.]|jgi:transposase|nr:transposase [Treponema sp.]
MAYSADCRKAAIAFKQAGHTFKELKEAFKITSRTYCQRIETLETSGGVRIESKRTRRGKTDPDALRKAVEEKPDACLRELSRMSGCSPSSVCRRPASLGFTYKKRHSPARKNPRRREWNFVKNHS